MANKDRKCIVQNCEHYQNARGYCVKHSNAIKKHGDPLYFDKMKERQKYIREHNSDRNYYGMLWRVHPNNKNCRRNYYDRGIDVCERWKIENDGRYNFLKDMGERPTLKHTLDRIDNDKGYSKDNCRWATKMEQANNRRGNKFIIFNSKKQTISEWARELNIGSSIIAKRLMANKSPSECLKPVDKNITYSLDNIQFKTKTEFCKYVEDTYNIHHKAVKDRLLGGATEEACILNRKDYTEYNKKLKNITNNKKCSVEACENKFYSKGLCSKHYQRFRKNQTETINPNH